MFGAVFLIVAGFPMIVLGLIIWKRQMISLIHDYHWKNVAEDDKGSYTMRIGQGVIVCGTGTLLCGVLNAVPGIQPVWGLILLGVSFVIGFWVLVRTQMRYNGGIF